MEYITLWYRSVAVSSGCKTLRCGRLCPIHPMQRHQNENCFDNGKGSSNHALEACSLILLLGCGQSVQNCKIYCGGSCPSWCARPWSLLCCTVLWLWGLGHPTLPLSTWGERVLFHGCANTDGSLGTFHWHYWWMDRVCVCDTCIFRYTGLFQKMQAWTYFPDWHIHIGGVEMLIMILGNPAYPLCPLFMKPYTGCPYSSKESYLVSEQVQDDCWMCFR